MLEVPRNIGGIGAEGKPNPMTTRFAPSGGQGVFSPPFPKADFEDENTKSIVVEFRLPFRFCDTCGKRRTGWRVRRNDNDWKRTCWHCQSPTVRRLVESIVETNDPKVRAGEERGRQPGEVVYPVRVRT